MHEILSIFMQNADLAGLLLLIGLHKSSIQSTGIRWLRNVIMNSEIIHLL